MTEELKYIPVEELYPHPDNPRKDVGDVTELAASIRTSGILQNLTVVPGHLMPLEEYVEYRRMDGYPRSMSEESYNRQDAWTSDGYTVIIGHRRLAAAKEAGLQVLPCIVAALSENQQFETMLAENMQRSDLTVLEEADGFQMMIDNWGCTVADISQRTGVSETTVRRRLNLGQLPREHVRKGIERGARLEDYAKLDQIKDPELKERCLKNIGTGNFSYEIQKAKQDEKDHEKIQHFIDYFRGCSWAKELTDVEYSELYKDYNYVRSYTCQSAKDVAMPEDAYTEEYCFQVVCHNHIGLYKKKKELDQLQASEAIRWKYRDKIEEIKQELIDEEQVFRDLREEFVDSFTAFHTYREEIQTMLLRALYVNRFNVGDMDMEALGTAINVAVDRPGMTWAQMKKAEFFKEALVNPTKCMLWLAYDAMEENDLKTWTPMYDSRLGCSYPIFNQNKNLELLYQMLEAIGYEPSKEEEAYMQGSYLQLNEAKALMDQFVEEFGDD